MRNPKAQRIDHAAEILDRVTAHERDRAGVLVNLHLDHVAAVRKGALPAGLTGYGSA
jgi:hypothetical protein